jgi:methyl-accepting chemotaxis protein
MRWFTNLKTRSKLLVAFGIVILLMIAIILTARTSLLALQEVDNSIADVMMARNAFNGQRAAMLGAAISPPGSRTDEWLQEVSDYSSENDEVLKQIGKDYGGDDELRPIVEQLISVRGEYKRVRDNEVIPFIRQQKRDEASSLILGAQSERFKKFSGLASDLTLRLTGRSAGRLQEAEFAFGVLGFIAIIASFGMAVGLGRVLAGPLERIAQAADKIADGDISTEFTDADRSDEPGALMQAFQRMSRSLSVLSGRARQVAEGDLTAEIKPRSERDVLGNAFANMVVSLRRVVQELLDSVNVLGSSATEIMASTTQLASSAAETATAITETTATVEEVKQTSQLSSQKAKSVATEAQKAVEVARSGKRAVDQTIEGMNGIRQQMGSVAESILSLSAQSYSIGEIIATVDDLAAQSKLLAVNASIEAAKAGEEGRGFSVVAQEVKSLAEQSKQATTQVRTILNDIQKATSSAVLATEQGSKAVETGVRQSTAAGDSIGTLADNIAGAAQAATQIAATSQQQFVGMDQVALAMENIKTAGAQTVASTKQAEIAAQQLHEVGQKLKQLVTQFKV